MLKIYTYSGCDTCRKAIKFLRERGIAFDEIPIRERPPEKEELLRALAAAETPRTIFNTSGRDYREEKIGDRLPSMTGSEIVDLLASNGNLIKRPFVVGHGEPFVGFKPDDWARRFGGEG